MEREKRTLLVNEIETWRKSKLLPEQYCDFLLNLYLDDPAERTQKWLGVSASSIRSSGWKGWFIAFAIFSSISFTILNFNSFHISLQISGSVLLLAFFLLFGAAQREKNAALSYLSIGIGVIFMLFIGPYLMKLHDVKQSLWVAGYVVLCSVLWIVIGMSMRIGLLQFTGWIGLILFYGWLLYHKLDRNADWYEVQLCWIPVAILFGWIGWLLHHRKKSIGAVLLGVSCLLWFAPEIYYIAATDTRHEIVQFSIFGKIIVFLVTSFLLRRKWTEWVV